MRRASGMSAAGTAFLNSAVRNFSTEYQRNFNAARARGVSMLDAPLVALGPTLMQPFLKMVVDTVSQIAESQISQFKCLNGQAKLESLCALAGGFIMPPAVLFTVIKNGARAISSIRGVETYMTAARRTFTATTRRAPHAPALTVAAREGSGARRSPAATRPRDPSPTPQTRARREATPDADDLDDAPIVNAAEDITEGVGNTADASQIVSEVVEEVGDDVMQIGDDMMQAGDDMAGSRRRKIATADELRRMGALDDAARVSAAETALGRMLSAEERSALLDAHYIGLKGPDGELLPLAERSGFGRYTVAQKRQKYLILRRAGLSSDEARALMDRGIAGASAGLDGTLADIAEATARREAILAENGDGLRPVANDRGRLEASRTLYDLEIESVVAARGNLTIAREATGEAAQTASRRAIEAATTSGDRELVIEAAQAYANSGGDMALLVADNRQRITALEAQLRTDPRNQALQSQLDARRTIKRRFDAPEVPATLVTPEVPAPRVVPEVKPTPVSRRRLQNEAGEFLSTAHRKDFTDSVLGDGALAREALELAAQEGKNPQFFLAVDAAITKFFDGSFYPKAADAVGRTSLPAAQELEILQTINQNFFRAQITTRGGPRTVAQEYLDRAYGGNAERLLKAQRNLNDRIRALGGTP